MCQFNFIVTDESVSTRTIKPILTELGFGYNEIENNSIKDQIKDFKKVILTTKGQCDCGSILGIDQSPSSLQIDIEKERKKLSRKKWSESKIDRYIEDKLKNQTRNDKIEDLGNKSEEERWLKLITTLTNHNIELYLFYHHFGGIIDEEHLAFKKQQTVTIDSINAEQLRNLEDSELLKVRRKSAEVTIS